MPTLSVIVPNWNGRAHLAACIDSLAAQSLKAEVIVVDNASGDGSADFVRQEHPNVTLLQNGRNLGFAGGVNTGIKYALSKGTKLIALLNNDAVANKDWLKHLVNFLSEHNEAGIVTSKMLTADGKHIDSTGDFYTTWGLPYPRGRGEPVNNKYDKDIWVFGASGGASLYRAEVFEQIGLFDEDFFAYYEDVDLSFRAQLAGWKIGYEPSAVVYHQIGASSSGIKGFAAYHTIKNLPLLLWKNVPFGMFGKIWIRLVLAWSGIVLSALRRGLVWPVIKGCLVGTLLWPKKLVERYGIQKSRRASASYIDSILIHDLPPNAYKLRRLRADWWRLRGKS